GRRERRAAKPRAELDRVEPEQGLELAEHAGRLERRLVAGLGLAVPGTHLLTHVAAEDPLADLLGEIARDVAAVLERPVRDASTRVEDVGRDERARGDVAVRATGR